MTKPKLDPMSRAEISRLGGLSKTKNQEGENNPNWKGGISKNNYHYKKVQKDRYPERIAAREKLHYAVKMGIIIKEPCCICGDLISFAHHDNYEKPYDIKWYCRKHHRELHGNKY